MAYDLLIKNGMVIDGSGKPGVRADVAIKDGLIAATGKVAGKAARVIDAEGRVVSPGFIDIHTHYDPHWWWNPLGTSSSWQGVTTVITGNCGLTLAPCKPENRGSLMGIFARVEEVSMATLDAALPWSWESFSEYMDRLAERGVGVNVGVLIGHNAIRLHVMGKAAGERAATADEISRMQDLARVAMEDGAFGWSTSLALTHVGPTGAPVPSRLSNDEELGALAAVLAEYSSGYIEIGSKNGVLGCIETDRETLRTIAMGSRRPVVWLGHSWKWHKPSLWRDEQLWMADMAKQGATLFAAMPMQPIDQVINLKRTTVLEGLDVWRDIMQMPLPERLAKLADPSLRPALRQAADHPDTSGKRGAVRIPPRWEAFSVLKTKLQKNKWMEGRSVAELAKTQDTHIADVICDLAVEEELATDFRRRFALESDMPVLGEQIQSPFVVLGVSDGGAHINTACIAGEPAYSIRQWANQRKVMTIEEAVRRWTSAPASIAGIRDRGLIKDGMKADVVVFSPEKIAPGTPEKMQDVPSGETRWVQKAEGIEYTIVNGRVLMEGTQPTGDLPGQVLRGVAYKKR